MNITQQFLTKNSYSRPGTPLKAVKGVVIHWVANPKSTATANRNFFENRKTGKSGYGSAQFITDGSTIIQCLPETEMAYAVGSNVYTASALRNLSSYPNNCTISIEMTHPDWTGKPDDTTYKTTVQLAAYLLKKYGLTHENLWTHHQIVGWKDCHRYYTNNPKAWVQFVSDVAKALNGKAVTISTPKKTDTNDLEYVPTLGRGDKGDSIKKLQKRLIAAGFSLPKYGADGSYGTETVNAVIALQKKAGIAADGIYGPATEKALTAIEASKKKTTSSKTVKKPSSSKKKSSFNLPSGIFKVKSPLMHSAAVEQIQTALAALHFYPDKKAKNFGIDSYYGPKTADAVRRFQLMNGLKADGIYGPATKAKLEALLK